jgi:transposase InsO family protein
MHVQVKHEYGRPRMHQQLRACGIRAGKKRVRQLMQRHGIRARTKQTDKATTDSKHSLPVAANLLQRNFNSPPAPRLCAEQRYNLHCYG